MKTPTTAKFLPACFTCQGSKGSTRGGKFYPCSDCDGRGTVAK